jgi:hypothetical protein
MQLLKTPAKPQMHVTGYALFLILANSKATSERVKFLGHPGKLP